MARKSKSKKDIQNEVEREVYSLKHFAVRKYRKFLKTGEEYFAHDFKRFLKEPLSYLKDKFPFIKEDEVVKEVIHFLGESKCIKTANGKSFFKFVKNVRDLEEGQMYRDIKIRVKNGRKIRIEEGVVVSSQQPHLVDCSSKTNGRSFGAGTEIISYS